MKGSTHLAIGLAIGAAATAYYPFSMKNAVIYFTVAGFSALSADLDGTGMLSSKLGKASKAIREFMLWAGILALAVYGYLYAAHSMLYPVYIAAAGTIFMLGLLTKLGPLRNGLVCAVGCILFYAGAVNDMKWLIGLGLYIAIVPWLNHRGLSHTVWALVLWSAIGRSLEHEIGVEGVEYVAAAGYLSHLIADTLTPSGVKWLYPLTRISFKFPRL